MDCGWKDRTAEAGWVSKGWPADDWDWTVAGESGNEVAVELGAEGLSIGRGAVGIVSGRGRRMVEYSDKMLLRNFDWRLQLVLEDED